MQSVDLCYDEATRKSVGAAKVLLIGVGGIGCEVLKNLVLSGFRNIDIIDLDTIDVSNLNRQFLFSRRDIGLSKAKSAKRSVLEFVPGSIQKDLNINDYAANIKESRFGVSFFEKFSIVLNALDNVSARQHVNRLCITTGVPLIDSGTTGYLGQVSIILKGRTRCYDCEPKNEAKAKTYAICTIRNTPDKPVHCIVWAKEVVKLLLGKRTDSMLVDLGNENEEEVNDEQHQQEIEVRSLVMKSSEISFKKEDITDDLLLTFCQNFFNAVFSTEIELKLAVKDAYQNAKFTPKPIPFDSLGIYEVHEERIETLLKKSQSVLEDVDCRDIFVYVLSDIIKERFDEIGNIQFDKDDTQVMRLVYTLAALRSSVFSIEKKSLFDTKGIAGNIIHAIATTNAIVAGMQTLEAIKLIQNKARGEDILKGVRPSWVSKEPTGSGCLIQPQKYFDSPKPGCVTCGKAKFYLHVDTSSFTLQSLVENVLKKRIGVNSPSITYKASEIYLEGDDLEQDELEFFKTNLSKILEKSPCGGIVDGSEIKIEDFSQDLDFDITIRHISQSDIDIEEYPLKFILEAKDTILSTKSKRPSDSDNSNEKPKAKRLKEIDTGGVIILQ